MKSLTDADIHKESGIQKHDISWSDCKLLTKNSKNQIVGNASIIHIEEIDSENVRSISYISYLTEHSK